MHHAPFEFHLRPASLSIISPCHPVSWWEEPIWALYPYRHSLKSYTYITSHSFSTHWSGLGTIATGETRQLPTADRCHIPRNVASSHSTQSSRSSSRFNGDPPTLIRPVSSIPAYIMASSGKPALDDSRRTTGSPKMKTRGECVASQSRRRITWWGRSVWLYSAGRLTLLDEMVAYVEWKIENAKDTLCRNVTIYGRCRYEDKGNPTAR